MQDKQHREQLSFTVLAYGEQLEVVLHRSDDLMSGRYAHVWRDPANGTLVHSRRHAVDHCYYHGKVAGEPRSIVTAHTCGDGIEASLRRESGEHLTLMPGSRVVEMREPPLMPAARRQAQDAKPHRGGQLPPHLVFRSSDQRLPGCPISHLAKVAAPVGYLDGEEFEHFSGGFTPMRLQRVDDGHRGLQTVLVPRGGCSCLDSWAYSVGGVLHEYPQGGCQNPDNDPTGSWCFTENQCGIGGSSTYQYCDEVDASGVPASPPPPPPPPSVAGCRYHVEVMMANDHTAFANMGSDLGAAQEEALMVANGVKEIYQEMSALQICITLVAVRSFTTSADEGSMYTTATDSIENFLDNWSDWYAVNAVEDSEGSGVDLSSDNGVLLTNIDRSGDTTGLGWVGSMCSTRTSSSVVEQNFHGIWQYTAETMAHEMGHNFGSHHDGVGEAAHCDDSEFIMAAVGCSNCGFSQFKAWSSCSETYIQDRLQSLANTPSDCLQNNPRAPVCGSGEESCATCGDFIVSGDEDCDMGTAGSNLCNGADSSSPCRLAAGVVCASGECCDTSTGQFKSPGNLCRDAMHQCDLPDYCSGTSATCGSDLFKADGTACTELGPGSQCYVGSCLGLDGQCGNAFQGYTGTWVAAARNGVQASCTQSYDGCNELLCTNTDWDDYCQVYDCPAGYRCTVDNLEISGPASHSFCSCDTKANLVGDSTQRVLIADGTACGPSDQDNICISNVCTPRPPPSGSASSDTGTDVADVDCVGAWSTCDASCQKLYSVSTQQSGVGAACAAAAGATATCTAGEGMCPPNVDCEGTWSTCSAACTQSYSISQDRSGSGDACEAAAAATRVCAAGTGDCPENRDCVGSWSTCGANCFDRVYTVSIAQSGNGAACPAAAGATRACNAGEGSCPVEEGDCVGSWSSCSADCGDKTYSISTQRTGSGAECPAVNGATEACMAGEGDCPADVDCAGAWSTCDASCQKLYSVSTQQSGVGAACAAAAGATATCTAGEGMCPPNVDCEGTWSTCSAACTQSYSISQDRSGSGDACEAAAAATRVCAAGTGDCPSLLGCVDASSCSHHGTCARDIQGTLTCACDPGWTGTICTEAFDCPQDCPGLLRHGCISPESCGACLPGHSYLGDNLLPTTACDLLPLSSVDPLSRLSSITANIKAGNSHADSVMDGNIYSHWVADFDDAMRIDQKPRIVMAYSAPVSLTHYSIMSANAHPSEDPESWMLECCSGGSCAEADDFETVDIRTGEMFDNRHQKHVYAIGGGDGTLISCTQVALRIAGIRDAETQGGGTIDATIGSDTIDAETTTSVTTDVSAEFSADVRVAEVEFFRRVTSNSWIDSVPTTAVSASVGLDADFETIGSDPDTDSYRNFVVDFKSDTATLLGVDEAQIVVNSVLAGSVLVDFTVSPDANGRSVTVVALSTAFSAPGVSVAGAMTISTIEPSAVAVTAVSYSASSGGSGTTNLPVSGLGTPEDGEDSIAGQVVFAVLLIVVVLGGACMCHGHLQEEPPPLPPHKGGGRGGGDDYDDVEVAKPVGQEVLQSGTLPSYESNDPEEGMPPPLLPSVARLELARCISSANKASGGGGAVDPAQVHAQFDELDLDRSGGLSQEEIELFVTQSLGYTPSSDYLSGVFAAFDRDGDGTVSEEEFAEMLKTLRRQAENAENPLQQP